MDGPLEGLGGPWQEMRAKRSVELRVESDERVWELESSTTWTCYLHPSPGETLDLHEWDYRFIWTPLQGTFKGDVALLEAALEVFPDEGGLPPVTWCGGIAWGIPLSSNDLGRIQNIDKLAELAKSCLSSLLSEKRNKARDSRLPRTFPALAFR